MTSDRRPAGTIELEHAEGVAVIRLLGEHDMATVADVREAIEGSIAADLGVVVSLSDAQFIDSGVTHALFKGDALAREKNRRLVLHVATASVVRQVLELSGLRSALPCTGSIETAIGLASAREGEPQWSSA